MSTHGNASAPNAATASRARGARGAVFSGTGAGWDQLTPRMREWLGADGVSDDGKWYRLYHGTRATHVASIRANGLQRPPGTGYGWYMLTTRLDDATGFAMFGPRAPLGGEGRVLEYRIPVAAASKYLTVGRPGNHYGADYGTYHALMQTIPSKWLFAVHHE